MSTTVFTKLQNFWNLVSMSTVVASDKVVEHCKCKFPITILTRWNSKYNVIHTILANKKNIITVFEELNLSKLRTDDWLFMEEYCSHGTFSEFF